MALRVHQLLRSAGVKSMDTEYLAHVDSGKGIQKGENRKETRERKNRSGRASVQAQTTSFQSRNRL